MTSCPQMTTLRQRPRRFRRRSSVGLRPSSSPPSDFASATYQYIVGKPFKVSQSDKVTLIGVMGSILRMYLDCLSLGWSFSFLVLPPPETSSSATLLALSAEDEW